MTANRTIKMPRTQRGITLEDFATQPRWVAWREEKLKGKQTKVPHDPKANRKASSNDATTWGTRKQAETAWRDELDDGRRVGGVGIVLGELDDDRLLLGIDLDGCASGKRIETWAGDVLERFDSYAEMSPSGRGIHVLCLIASGDVAEVKRLFGRNEEGKLRTRKAFSAGNHCEIAIDRQRYYTVTDEVLPDRADTLRTAGIDDVRWLIEEAGPAFLKQHGVNNAAKKGDQSGSGHGFRFMRERKAAGDTYEQACAAILDDQTEAGDWARRVNERQLRRAWDKLANVGSGEKRKLISRSIDQFERKKLRWLWRPFIPLGMITTMIGDKGLGKSSLAIDSAARISTGSLFPCFGNDKKRRAPLGSVIILCKENDFGMIIRPRLEAAGADITRVHTLGYEVADDPKQLDLLDRLDTTIQQLEELVIAIGDVRLIVIDPITDYLGDADMYRDDRVRQLLNPLGRLASQHELAILNILHVNKKQDSSAQYRGLGSVAFRNVSQSTLLVAPNGNTGERYLAQDAANHVAKTRAVTFSMSSVGAYHRIDWGNAYCDDLDLDEVMSGKTASKIDRAKTLLREVLAEGPLASRAMLKRGADQGIGRRTMFDAKRALNIKAHKSKDGTWSWKLP
jgi:hypothetical protein